jgi:hypothetical protein
MPEEAPENRGGKRDAWIAGIQGFAQIFTTLVETFGWPGASVVLTFWFVVWYATTEQKQRIIETYILGAGISRIWPLLVLSLVFVAVVLAQKRLYDRKTSVLSGELEREGQAKSRLQEKKITRPLQHAKTKTMKPKGK